MAHFGSYIAGKFAKEAATSAAEEMGFSRRGARIAGTVAQVSVGLATGLLTFDVGGKVATFAEAVADLATDAGQDSLT